MSQLEGFLVNTVICGLTAQQFSATIPDGKYLYEVADGESDGEPARIKPGIMVNFFGSIVCNQELKPDEGETIWLEEGDWIW